MNETDKNTLQAQITALSKRVAAAEAQNADFSRRFEEMAAAERADREACRQIDIRYYKFQIAKRTPMLERNRARETPLKMDALERIVEGHKRKLAELLAAAEG